MGRANRLLRRVVFCRVRPVFAWYDLWVGVYWDCKGLRLYVLPLPCLGVVFDFNSLGLEPWL